MLRRPLSILLVSLLAGCSAGESARTPVADASAPAGDVVAIDGNVTARRAAATTSRALALDAQVFADDEVVTAAAATVQIRLAHNDALWTLGSGRAVRVDSTAAWSAPRATGGDLVLVRDDREDRTRAAARTGSQEGISSGEVALDSMPVPATSTARRNPPEQPKGTPVAAAAATPSFGFTNETGISDALTETDDDKTGLGGLGIRSPMTGGGGGDGTRGISGIGKGSGTGSGSGSLGFKGSDLESRVVLERLTVLPVARTDVVGKVLKLNWNQVRYCVERELAKNPAIAGKVVVEVVLSPDGKPEGSAAKTGTTIDGPVTECIVGRAKLWTFPPDPAEKITSATFTVVVKSAEPDPAPTASP